MYLFLYIIVGLIVGILIDTFIMLLFEGIKKLTNCLTGNDPDDDIFTSMKLAIYNTVIIFITAMVSIISYFVLD